ncbi:MAG TPA: glycosyltransferase [Thermoanaerobaculia bacterium]|nr:glycosyltransferase [Thermoanaerobaculia bacterium]
MRILLLIPTLTGGGAERQLAYLESELRARGYDALAGYIYDGAGVWPDELPAHRLPQRAPWSPLQILDILRLIRAWKPDVVQTCLARMDVAGGVAAMLAGVPFVLREPNSAASYRNFKSLLRKVVGRGAAAIVANSVDGAAYWRARRTFVIPNGVPSDAIAGAKPVARPAAGALAVYVGRLTAEKNVDVLLRAAAEVMAERELFLILCGDGPERERLEALAETLGIAARVQFTGFVQSPWRYQRAADVALLLSDFEGLPNAAAECFAAGTPMVLSDISAHRELAGDDALLVPPGDAAAAAAAIRSVLDDPAAAARRAKRAQGRVRNWSIARMAATHDNVYTMLTGPRPRPRKPE